MPHFSLAPVSSPHVSACPICPPCLSLSHMPQVSSPHFSACPICPKSVPPMYHLPQVSSPNVLACPQSVTLMCQPAPFARPPVALSACPVSVSKSLYFVRPDDAFVISGRESYFVNLFCGEIVLATSNDIHRRQHFFSREQDVFVIIERNFVSYDISLDTLHFFSSSPSSFLIA